MTSLENGVHRKRILSIMTEEGYCGSTHMHNNSTIPVSSGVQFRLRRPNSKHKRNSIISGISPSREPNPRIQSNLMNGATHIQLEKVFSDCELEYLHLKEESSPLLLQSQRSNRVVDVDSME